MSELKYKPKLSIKDIPVANERLYDEVSKLTKTAKSEVKRKIEFIGEYVAATMKRGDMEGVMIPYFGKFRVKKKRLQAMKRNQMHKANGMDVVYHAVKGKLIVGYKPKI